MPFSVSRWSPFKSKRQRVAKGAEAGAECCDNVAEIQISVPSKMSPEVVVRAEAGDTITDLTRRVSDSLCEQCARAAHISSPSQLHQEVRVTVDPGAPLGLQGLPRHFQRLLREGGFTKDEILGSLPAVLACIGCHDRAVRQPPPPKPPRQVRRYRLKELTTPGDPEQLYADLCKLDSGSQGAVYRARRTGPGGGPVALKRIYIRDQKADLPALENEISMLSSCRHPNIVSFNACHLHQGVLWISMELMNGGKLTDLLEDGHRFEEPEIAFILREVMQGIRYLHGTGRVHRDIKSDNVLLSTTGQVKLADFGFCAMLSEGNNAKRRSVVGTPYWMAPEVIRGDPYDGKADVWSLGVLGLELCDGEPPLMSLPPMRALYVIVSQPAPRVRSAAQRAEECVTLVEAALAKDPLQRPDVAELLDYPFVRWAQRAERGFLRAALCRV